MFDSCLNVSPDWVYSERYSDHTHQSPARHRCCECAARIPRFEPHWKYVGFDPQDDRHTFHMCTVCLNIWRSLSFDIQFGILNEALWENYGVQLNEIPTDDDGWYDDEDQKALDDMDHAIDDLKSAMVELSHGSGEIEHCLELVRAAQANVRRVIDNLEGS